MIIVGADESGTGAWAGPFTVCACAIYERDAKLLTKLGITDSKAVSDKKRRAMVNDIVDLAVIAKCEVVAVAEITKQGLKEAWRFAMFNAICGVAKDRDCKVVVDGNPDPRLKALLGVHRIRVEFMVKADSQVPVVGAASIIAKTVRNDAMIKLHDEFPEYGWKVNAGYGVPEHEAALREHGKTHHHRPYKNLADVPDRKH